MKKILFGLFILSSLGAHAGDMYLVCEDENNDKFFSSTIDEGKARMMLPMSKGMVMLEINQMRSNSKTRFDLKITDQNSNHTNDIRLKIFEEIKVGTFLCLVRD